MVATRCWKQVAAANRAIKHFLEITVVFSAFGFTLRIIVERAQRLISRSLSGALVAPAPRLEN